jgi:outer membrane protein assembly factor BamB
MTATPRLLLLLALAGVALGGCSTISETASKLNPFSSSPKVKAAELTPIQATVDLRVRWQAGVGTAGDFVFTPAVSGNSVYAASRDGTLARFDDGRQVWRVSAGQVLSGGVGTDGKLVAVGTLKGEVLTFDAETGNAGWKARVSSEVLAAPAIGDGLVVVRSGDSHLFGLEAADGKRRWTYQRSTPTLSLRSNVGVLMSEQVVVAGYPGGKLAAINSRNGAPIWEVTVALPKGSTELERVADVSSLPVVDGRQICTAAFQGRVSCFDISTGNMLWGRDISSSAGLDMDKRHVYVSDDNGTVFAFDRDTGASVWKQDRLSMRSVSRPLALGRYVVVADYQGFVHLLNRDDGAFAGRLATDGSAVVADPLPLARGVLVQTRNGGVFALTTGE